MQHRPTTDEILHTIQAVMKSLFNLEAEQVHPGARLMEDLDLDSIDAIDLAAKIEEETGHVFDEASLRQLRTIQDVVEAIQQVVVVEEEASPRERIPA